MFAHDGVGAHRRVLVTGAAGRIGTAVVERLAAVGSAVIGVDRTPHPDRPLPETVEFVAGDVNDPGFVSSLLAGVDAVVHLAAIPHPSLDTPFNVYSHNVVGTWSVLTAAAESGVGRVVVASSINALGLPFNPHRALPAYFPLDEDTPPDLADAYSLSKRSGEQAAGTAARAWGLSVVSLRFPLVTDEAGLGHAVTRTTDDPDATIREGWSYLDVRDAAEACRAAIAAGDGLAGRAVVVQLAADDILIDAPTEQLLDRWAPGVPRRRRFPGRSALVDTTRARQLLGFTPAHSVHADRPIEEPARA